jgi:hypothetical protein
MKYPGDISTEIRELLLDIRSDYIEAVEVAKAAKKVPHNYALVKERIKSIDDVLSKENLLVGAGMG